MGLIKVSEISLPRSGGEASKNTLTSLRRYYQTAAAEYDSFLQEEMSIQETQSFITLLPEIRENVVLDVACGTGRITSLLTSSGTYYVGLDLSDSMLAILARKTRRENADLVCASALQLPFHDSSFRMVTCLGLTGYINGRQQETLMQEFSRVLKGSCFSAIDFLRPHAEPSLAIQREEERDGNKVFLLDLKGIIERIQGAGFKIAIRKKTPRQIQFLIQSQK